MAGIYDSPLVLTSDAADARAAIAVARKHALPLELRSLSRDADAVRHAEQAAREAGVPVDVMLYAAGFEDIDAMQAAARALAATKQPFVLGLSASMAGGSISDVIARIDGDLAARPWHYMLDDLDPAQAEAALAALFRAAPALAHRVVGLIARASEPSETPEAFGRGVRECARNFGLHVLGSREGNAALIDAIASGARAEV